MASEMAKRAFHIAELVQAIARNSRCRRFALRAVVVPVMVAALYPFYVFGAVAYTQFSLQQAVDGMAKEDLRAFEASGVHRAPGAVVGRPNVALTVRYLSANGKVIAVVSAAERYAVEAPFLSRFEFSISAQSRIPII